MKNIVNKLVNNKYKFSKKELLGIISLIIVFSGVFGYIYEFIFYYINGGCKEFYLQGGNFLPWINIYAIGAILVFLTTKKIWNKPVLLFLLSSIITGVLEYFSGWLIYTLHDGTRYWDYNREIWNFGNINGFICLRSVLIFGVFSCMLIYVVVPIIIKIMNSISLKTFLIISITLCSIFLLDEAYNGFIRKITNTPSAMEVYESLGYKYYKFE